jgi:hypothetical protein
VKFKGIKRDGANMGVIIEFTPEEKIAPAMQDAVIVHEKYKDKEHVWVRNVNTTSLNFTKKGDPLVGQYAHNVYTAEGSVEIHRRTLKDGSLLVPHKHTFNIRFEDCLDVIGQPDLRVLEFELR